MQKTSLSIRPRHFFIPSFPDYRFPQFGTGKTFCPFFLHAQMDFRGRLSALVFLTPMIIAEVTAGFLPSCRTALPVPMGKSFDSFESILLMPPSPLPCLAPRASHVKQLGIQGLFLLVTVSSPFGSPPHGR